MNERNRAEEVKIAWQLMSVAMLTRDSVRSIEKIAEGERGRIHLPSRAGVYAFWWIGDRATLLGAKRDVVLKGPKGRDVDVHYDDWWPDDAPYPCLYVGKTTDLKQRFSQNIMRGTSVRAHPRSSDIQHMESRNSTCQLRFGIEHIFPNEEEPLTIIKKSVGYSYFDQFEQNAVAERFFAEDWLIGHMRPWFNVDSER